MSDLVARSQPPAEHDPLALFIEGARMAAHRARERWRDHGGRLAEAIDEELARYERQLREVL